MVKRPIVGVDDGNEAYLKRQKISNFAPTIRASEEIRSGRQLRQLLAFDQDSGRSKYGIQSLKSFLDAFNEIQVHNASHLLILKEYLESQTPADEEDKAPVYLPELMKTWAFAAQSNNESLLSAVPAVLALLLRTLSGNLEFKNYGLGIGRTLLQKSQLELIARGLRANKSREFLISPVLRVLKEVVTFDGGALSNQVFRARDYVLQGLPRNLNLKFAGNGVEDKKRPSVRTHALRFTLSLVKLLPSDGKRELLSQRDIISALSKHIKDDAPFMVREIIESLTTSILQDSNLPRDTRTKLINASFLSRIATLYQHGQRDEEENESSKKSVETLVHEFLITVCTSPDLGPLNRQSGFYPRGVDPDDTDGMNFEQSFIDLGLDSVEWMNRFTDKVPLRNTLLSDFIQNLRPWSSRKQTELILSIFRSAPELVAEYFYNRKDFAFDPKLTATWIGYSAFLYSTIDLPLPKYFGHQEGYARLPPPPAIVLENILPQPLTQKVLRSCFLQDQSLIIFSVARILINSFKKLRTALEMYREASSGQSSAWAQAAQKLRNKFCERCPSMKDVIFAFRKTSDRDLLQREAISQLLVLYYEIAPQIALDAKFDVSEALAKALRALEDTTLSSEERAMRQMELENLFQFARFSPGMRWFNEMEGFKTSPFMTMLKISAKAPPMAPLLKLRTVIDSIVAENQLLQTHTSISALDSLILGLREIPQNDSSEIICMFIDDCISRCATKPIKYIFNLEDMHADIQMSGRDVPTVSLLNLVIADQWPFLVKSVSDHDLQTIARFLAAHLARATKTKESKKAIKSIAQKISSATPVASPACAIIKDWRKLIDDIDVPEARTLSMVKSEHENMSQPSVEAEKAIVAERMMEVSHLEVNDNASLTKWMTKEVVEVIEGGHAAALIMLLSSGDLSVRKEAVTNILKLAAKLKESSLEEKDQIWLLLCEVVETAKRVVDQEALATVISSFASHAVGVLADPLHALYPKINKFLSQNPTWDLTKIPLIYKIINEPPSLDDAYYTEINWLLTVMLSGLRTKADMDIFRRRRVFEKLLSIYSSPYLGPGLRDKILRILFKATIVEGGSTTLITRFSVMTWLQAQLALQGGMALKILMERVLESCDQDRVNIWSKNGARELKEDTMRL